jgi:uncharacterized protein YkwD
MKFALLVWFLASSLLWAQSDFVREALQEINEVRREAKLAELTLDIRLNSLAQLWAVRLSEEQRLVHRSLDNLKKIVVGNKWRGMNENLHCSSDGDDAAFVIRSWMNSPRHKGNLLMPNIRLAGLGLAKGKDGQFYVTFNGATP